MNESEYYTSKTEQDRLYSERIYEMNISVAMEQFDYNLFSMLKPRLFKDGDRWCVLYGDNLHDGVAGFGDTPYEAVVDWNKNWRKK